MFLTLRRYLRLRQLRKQRKYPCCRSGWNLTRRDSGREDLYLEVCGCGRRHFYAKADMGAFGALLSKPKGA